MKRGIVLKAILLLFFLASSPVWARGGGGCLIKGTPVQTPSGAVAIEELRVGDRVWSFSGDKIHVGTVRALTEISADRYLEISAGNTTVTVTSEHPMMVGPGEYRVARQLNIGDMIYLVNQGNAYPVPVRSIQSSRANLPAYNLLVFPGGTYISANVVVHNKGCFLPESPVMRSDGSEMPISAVRPGDELLAYSPEGRTVPTRVKDIIRHRVDEYIILRTDRQTIRVTAEHPFYVKRGTFKTLEVLKVGDNIFAWDGRSFLEQPIVSLEKVHERVPVFNLQTDYPNTFIVGGLAVHNKGGGCFPAGTRIRTPSGEISIEMLSAGDEVQTVGPDGQIIHAEVEKLFATRADIFSVETEGGVLRTTSDHPVGLLDGTFIEAGRLQHGDKVLTWVNGALSPTRVVKTSTVARGQVVFNLSVGGPHTFLAEGFLTHNKGGGFRSSSSSGRGGRSGQSESSFGVFIFVILLLVIVLILAVKFKLVTINNKDQSNLDYMYSPSVVAKKAMKTEKLLEFLSRQDSSVSKSELRALAEATFRKLQECWEKRDYGPMESLLVRALFEQHKSQLGGLARNHEINRIESLKVEQVDIVNIRYTERPDQREFTALITASARDYYVDDRTNKFLRGDGESATFQEFWTFQRSSDGWLLREIEQAGESDVLKDENFVEMLTDQTLQGIYSEMAGKEGKAGPWLEKGTEEKATRIDRMLNFLVRTDKLWNRQQMIERARQVFLSVFLARESCDPVQAPEADLFPEVAASLRKQILQWQIEGTNVEYRNLCVRKAELILIRNFTDPAKDEFSVRISAHAQKIVHKGNQILSEQQYVTPFEEYWTFGRLDEVWKLKEVLQPARGEKLIAVDNVDEDSSTGQMQWYYRQTRAN